MSQDFDTGRDDMNPAVLAVSGGPDSVYLFIHMTDRNKKYIVAHVDHGARGKDSDGDFRLVERLAYERKIPIRVKILNRDAASSLRGRGKETLRKRSSIGPAFEATARRDRYRFLHSVMEETGAEKLFIAHTADDQVETVLMRVLEGAGIAGLKGIPRKTRDGIERPILDVWRVDILKYLKKNKIPFRVDRSNLNTRFERNWIRHVLIPLLEKRYGKSIRKRIFQLGERFREIDLFLESTARRWVGRNLRAETGGTRVIFRRKPYGRLPSELRVRILQILCFEKARVAPNERLLKTMDRLILSGGPSARLAVGKGVILSCSYEDAGLAPEKGAAKRKAGMSVTVPGPGLYEYPRIRIRWEENKGGMRASTIRKRSVGEKVAFFDAEELRLPLTVRPLRYGDRIRPFGMEAEKRVKEILIDRKVPRDKRWGRPIVCDANGGILWIPEVIRSAHAPVTSATTRTAVLKISNRNT